MGHVGEQVRRLREEKGWTQPRLSVETGLAVSGISQIENGRRNPNAGTLAKLAGALGVEVADFFPKAEAPLPFEEEQWRSPFLYDKPWLVIGGFAEEWERTLDYYDTGVTRSSADAETKEIFRVGWSFGTCAGYVNATALIARDFLEAATGPLQGAYTSQELADTAEAVSRVYGIARRVEEEARPDAGSREGLVEALEAPRRRLLELASKVA